MVSGTQQLIVGAPRVLRQTTNIAILRVVARFRLSARLFHQRGQPLLRGGIAAVVQLVHIQRALQRHDIADGFLPVGLLFVAHQIRYHQAGQHAENNDHHHDF
ncbi:hypothetical protein AU493_06560 [Lonsdalea populi]|nr:hypothetical protein AU493_06560 [Lonsdalea populi]